MLCQPTFERAVTLCGSDSKRDLQRLDIKANHADINSWQLVAAFTHSAFKFGPKGFQVDGYQEIVGPLTVLCLWFVVFSRCQLTSSFR